MDSLRLILSNIGYFAPSWVFASLNIITGTWVLYLPYIKTKFALNDAQIGFALFCLAAGILISIPFVPWINRQLGVGRSTKMGILLYALMFNIPLIAPQFTFLCVSLFLIGFFSGITDVSMNALVVTIEQKERKNFMSAAHGFFSLGGFIGSGIGSILILFFSTPFWHMSMISSFVILSNLFLAKHYDTIKDPIVEKKAKKKGIKHLQPLFGLALVAFIIMCSEGAVEHWSNLFLFDIVQVSQSKAGFGFIAFSLCMTLGRFLGDGISQKLGSIKVILYGCLIAFIAYFLILTSNLYPSVFGFGLLGFGLSVIIPELFRLAGRTKSISTSVAISFVSGIGFAGFLLGPVLLGFISNITNLTYSYIFLSLLVVVAFVLVLFHLKKRYPSS